METDSTTTTESATCTICGLKCDDRSAFNAHIRAHLKDKLTNRRKLQQQQQHNIATPTAISVTPSSSSLASACPRDSVKRAKVVQPAVPPSVLSPGLVKPVKDKTMTNIQNLLPSSPLPMASTCIVKDKPDLEALLSQLQQRQPQQTSDPLVMAELAACKPIPPTISKPPPTPLPPPPLLKTVLTKSPPPPPPLPVEKIKTEVSSIPMPPCTPEISDMEDDLMSYEMEMNRIDFHNDLACLLDQIEKDFESPGIGHDFRLDTPPDSDCETDSFGRLLSQMSATSPTTPAPVATPTLGQDLMGFDRFSQRIDEANPNPTPLLNGDNPEDTIKLIQSPASVAKVGKLPAKTLAVLNKLPARLFVPNQLPSSLPPSNDLNSVVAAASGEQRFVDVVKVENSTNQMTKNGPAGQLLTTPGTQCIINIECRNANEPSKIIQSFRAIDTGTEIKLVPADLSINTKPQMATGIAPTPAAIASIAQLQGHPQVQAPDSIQQQQITDVATAKVKASSTSHCPICNKCITNKNMARHLEKHRDYAEADQESNAIIAGGGNEKRFVCKYCFKTFSQRSLLSRHAKCHNTAAAAAVNSSGNNQLTCRVCGKVCKNRMSLDRHRAKHLACIHCSALFENKITLQDHLLKAHPEKAIVSLVQPPQPPEQDTRLDLDDLGSIGSNASHSVDYSFSPAAPIIGESLADIADSNYFYCGSSDITDDLYSTDLFSTSATAQTC